MDVLRIEELMVDCVVGVYPHERNASQPLRVDVEMRLDTEASAVKESFSSTVDYAATVIAFKQDAVKLRYDDWADLMGYCENSANPVGRYLLDLHGERVSGYAFSDALCSALQVLNHLQDCQDDYRALDRVYLPLDWMGAQGIEVSALEEARSGPGLRRVLDRCLDGVAELMRAARELPAKLRSPRLAMESAIIVRLAERLTVLLRRGDPLAGRVALGRVDFLACGLRGAGGVLVQRGFGGGPAERPARQRPSAKRNQGP